MWWLTFGNSFEAKLNKPLVEGISRNTINFFVFLVMCLIETSEFIGWKACCSMEKDRNLCKVLLLICFLNVTTMHQLLLINDWSILPLNRYAFLLCEVVWDKRMHSRSKHAMEEANRSTGVLMYSNKSKLVCYSSFCLWKISFHSSYMVSTLFTNYHASHAPSYTREISKTFECTACEAQSISVLCSHSWNKPVWYIWMIHPRKINK